MGDEQREIVGVTWEVIFPPPAEIARRGLCFKFVVAACAAGSRPKAIVSEIVNIPIDLSVERQLLGDPEARLAHAVYRRLKSEYIFKRARALVAGHIGALVGEGSLLLHDGPLFRELAEDGPNAPMIGVVYEPRHLVTTVLPWGRDAKWFSDLGYLISEVRQYPGWIEGDAPEFVDKVVFLVPDDRTLPLRLDLKRQRLIEKDEDVREWLTGLHVQDFISFQKKVLGRAIRLPKYLADAREYRRKLSEYERDVGTEGTWDASQDAE